MINFKLSKDLDYLKRIINSHGKITIFLMPFFIFWALPLCILLRLISKIILIRIGTVRSDRIGHFAKDVGLYLAEKELENKKKSIDFFFSY